MASGAFVRSEGIAARRNDAFAGGHLLIAKEKKPAVLIEFGPPHSRSAGLVRGGALLDRERWPVKKCHHRNVAPATWIPHRKLAK
jgi:hypothetical protein